MYQAERPRPLVEPHEYYKSLYHTLSNKLKKQKEFSDDMLHDEICNLLQDIKKTEKEYNEVEKNGQLIKKLENDIQEDVGDRELKLKLLTLIQIKKYLFLPYEYICSKKPGPFIPNELREQGYLEKLIKFLDSYFNKAYKLPEFKTLTYKIIDSLESYAKQINECYPRTQEDEKVANYYQQLAQGLLEKVNHWEEIKRSKDKQKQVNLRRFCEIVPSPLQIQAKAEDKSVLSLVSMFRFKKDDPELMKRIKMLENDMLEAKKKKIISGIYEIFLEQVNTNYSTNKQSPESKRLLKVLDFPLYTVEEKLKTLRDYMSDANNSGRSLFKAIKDVLIQIYPEVKTVDNTVNVNADDADDIESGFVYVQKTEEHEKEDPKILADTSSAELSDDDAGVFEMLPINQSLDISPACLAESVGEETSQEGDEMQTFRYGS